MSDNPFTYIHHSGDLVSLVPSGKLFGEKLRKYFQNQITNSAHYASVFQKLGLDSTHPPMEILGEIPPTTKEVYRETLQLESLSRLNESSFVTDYSSGSTADSVLRMCALPDDLAEQSVTESAFAAVGMGPGDHFICMEIGAIDIYDFYFRAARNLGVDHTSFLHLTQDYEKSCAPLFSLRPTILLTVPSILIRAWPVISNYWMGEDCPIRTVIHMGEPMHDSFRREVECQWNCQVRSFYGTTETGGIGVDCEYKTGIHFDPRFILPTLESAKPISKYEYEGEVLFTTLHIRTQSVIKYRVGDRVRLDTKICPCGNTNPRLTFLERTHEAFMIAGDKFTHAMILEGLQESAPDLPLANLVIEDLDPKLGDALLRVQLPDSYQKMEAKFLYTLEKDIFELDALHRYGLVKFQLEFLPIDKIPGRKMTKVRDNRLHMRQDSRLTQPD
mgnify:CR=1 FL=1|jgi:phenylacetate-CoA ligase